MTEEEYCLAALAELQRAYQRDAKPYIDRLVYIRSVSPQPMAFHWPSPLPYVPETHFGDMAGGG